MFFSRIFTVSGLTLRSLIHFEFIFVYGVRKCSSFILLQLLLLLSRFSHVQLCATPEMEAHQAPPSLGFSRQEHWSGLPFPSPMNESEREVAQSCPTLSDPMDYSLPGSSIPWDFPGKSTGVGCHCLLCFTTGWPVFPIPLVKEIVFNPLYILASFVKDKVCIGAWVYLWAFYFAPLIYISVFVPVPYCLHDCGFVVEPEVGQVDSSSSILLSQDCFGYSRFFCISI